MRSIRRRFTVIAALIVGMTTITALGPTAGNAQSVPDDESANAVTLDGPAVGADVRAAVAASPSVVVVALDETAADGPIGIGAAQADVLAGLPSDSFEELHRFSHVPAMVLRVDDTTAIDALADTPGVVRVDLDVGGTGSLDVTVPLTEANRRHARGNDGDGIVVAVLDTGIDTDHPDLVADVIGAGQACFGFNGSAGGAGFCPDGSDGQTGPGAAEDDAGHGTHVSGIVSGDGAANGAVGFAPGAEVLGIKVMDNCSFAGCFYSFALNVVAALDYIIANPQLGVRVINMSLAAGGGRFTGDCDNATAWTMAGASAINTLWANNVVAFAAAGNDSDRTAMTAPACLSNVISVGASTDSNGPAGFTNNSPTTDIFAPGVNVISSRLGGGSRSASGTSMASPSAAGCAALLMEAGEATTSQAILDRLKLSGTFVFSGGPGYPRIECGNDQASIRPLPCPFYDSRTATGTLGGPVPGNATRTVQVTGTIPNDQGISAGGSCVPTGASSVIMTVTAIDPSGVGNLRVAPEGVTAPGGVVNYTSNGLNNANTITVPVSADGRIDVTANVSATDVRLTAIGFYDPAGRLDYVPLTPCAAADSRTGVGEFAGPVAAGTSYAEIDVMGFFSPDQGTGVTDCGVPTDAVAVAVNLVAVRPPGGFGGKGVLEATSRGVPMEAATPFADLPLNNATSTVVFMDNTETINIDVEAVSGSPSTHIRVVVLGYFDDAPAEQYRPVTPCAAFDSRSGSGAFGGPRVAGSGGVTSYDVTGTMSAAQGAQTDCGVPDDADAVLINLVAIQPGAVGNFRAYATGSTPTGGVLNFAPLNPAMNNSNAVVVPVSDAGSLDLFINAPSNNGQPTVHARGVILGYFD